MEKLEAIVKGTVLFGKLVDSGIVEELNKMFNGISKSRWLAEDVVEVFILGEEGQQEKVSVMTPHHEAGSTVNPAESYYAVICKSQELILNTLEEGWKRTGYTMKF